MSDFGIFKDLSGGFTRFGDQIVRPNEVTKNPERWDDGSGSWVPLVMSDINWEVSNRDGTYSRPIPPTVWNNSVEFFPINGDQFWTIPGIAKFVRITMRAGQTGEWNTPPTDGTMEIQATFSRQNTPEIFGQQSLIVVGGDQGFVSYNGDTPMGVGGGGGVYGNRCPNPLGQFASASVGAGLSGIFLGSASFAAATASEAVMIAGANGFKAALEGNGPNYQYADAGYPTGEDSPDFAKALGGTQSAGGTNFFAGPGLAEPGGQFYGGYVTDTSGDRTGWYAGGGSGWFGGAAGREFSGAGSHYFASSVDWVDLARPPVTAAGYIKIEWD